MKTCYHCKESLPLTDFRPWGPYREGVRSICRPCEKAYNKARYDAGGRRPQKKTPEQRERYRQREERKRLARYGLTPASRDALRAKQGGNCATCRKPLRGGRREHVDHDHGTGIVRGILCHGCNVALGHVKENVDTLQAMIDYLHAASEAWALRYAVR